MSDQPRMLTGPEDLWVKRLRRVLAECPPSLHLLTHGDRYVEVIDAELTHHELHDGRAEQVGAVLAVVRCASLIHGVSG